MKTSASLVKFITNAVSDMHVWNCLVNFVQFDRSTEHEFDIMGISTEEYWSSFDGFGTENVLYKWFI